MRHSGSFQVGDKIYSPRRPGRQEEVLSVKIADHPAANWVVCTGRVYGCAQQLTDEGWYVTKESLKRNINGI